MNHFVSEFSFHIPSRDGDQRSSRKSTSLTFSIAVDEDGFLAATAFGQLDQLLRRANLGDVRRDDHRTKHVRAQVEAYCRGEISLFSVPLKPVGSPFQQRVWRELQKIPHGSTRSYGSLAKELESSPRAVGRANATNPICLIVPCHRVIGADGSLTGFAFGEEVKRQLLLHEGVVLTEKAR